MTLRAVIPGLLLALLLSASAHSAEPPVPDAWRWSHFTVADGLPSSFVTSAVDVPGDALWAVTRGGLARFDGYRWHPVPLPGGVNDPQVVLVPGRHGEVTALSNGALFSGTAAGLREVRHGLEDRGVRFVSGARAAQGPLLLLSEDGTLYEWDGIACRRHDTHLSLGRVHVLLGAGAKMVWVSADRGLACWDGIRWRFRLRARNVPFTVLGLFEADDESAWAYIERPADARGLWYWRREETRPVRTDVPSPITALGTTRGGELIAVHATGDLTVRRGNRWLTLPTGTRRVLDVRSLGLLSNGDLALSSDHGLFLYRGSADRWSIHAFPPPDDANSINDLARGPDGSLWLATSHGLARLARDGRIERLPGLGLERLTSITGLAFDRRGRLWVSSGYGFRGVRWRDQTGWHRLDADPLLDGNYIHRVSIDRDGGVWFLGLSDNADRTGNLPRDGPGAFRLAPDGTLARWGTAEGLPSGRVYAFDQGPDGAYWFGTLAGLSRWSGGQWRHWSTRTGLRTSRVFTLAVDSAGTVWFGHQSSGLGHLQGNRISYVGSEDGLASDAIWQVRPDSEGRVWVTGEGGVSLLDHGIWTSFDAGSGLPITRVWPVLPEADRVCFGTSGGGLAVLKLSSPSPPPVVAPERGLVEDDTVVVRWHAFSWWAEVSADAVPTRIRLDDRPWSAWTRDREYRYSGLTPGHHRVSIQAKGLLGTLGPVSAPVVVTIDPPLFERPVVYVPMTSLALVIAGLVGFIGVRQRQHHLALHEREELFGKVFHASPLPTVITGFDDGRCVDLNAAFERLVGRPRTQLLGQTAEELGVVAGGLRHKGLALALGEQGMMRGLPVKLQRPSGEFLDVLAYLEVFELGGRQSILTQVIDVTEQRRLEAQLRHAQKMESVGRLAGGVAHDFNNLLTVILGNTALVDAELAAGHPRRDELDQIKIAAERAERLTRQLLAFARKQVVEPRVVNVNDIVLRTDRMLRRLIGEDIELVTITPEVWPAFIDPGQLEQVLLNMAVNARDAMPAGGKLIITTSNTVIGVSGAECDPETVPGEYVRLSIADSGVGMDAVTAARVFDPFFTTKEAGKGTGLGLAMCYGIVKQAGGQILVETSPGQGTTFHVDLPRATASGTGTESRDRTPETPGGQETVLLVEDEVQVRRLAASVLRQRGYEVLEAADGPEALQLSAGYHGRIEALVTDVVMPQMRGTEVAKALTAMRPELKVLYMSGYTDDDRFRQEADGEGFAFLAKPFTPSVLARRLREVLDSEPR